MHAKIALQSAYSENVNASRHCIYSTQLTVGGWGDFSQMFLKLNEIYFYDIQPINL